MVVEMDFMQNPPYVIDFGKVRINFPPDFDEHKIADDEAKNQDRFGKNWPKVQVLLKGLESFLIFYFGPFAKQHCFSDRSHIAALSGLPGEW